MAADTADTTKRRALISDSMSDRAREILEAGGVEVTVDPKITPERLAEVIGEYDALLVRSRSQVPAALLERATRLKIVARAGAGVDNVDVPAATRRGVFVVNAPGGNTVTTAEHALAMMMALARHIPQATASMKAGRWEKNAFMGAQLQGATLGVVGYGNIGRIVATRGVGLGMRVLVYDPFVSADTVAQADAVYADLPQLLREADFVSIHVPLTKDTRGLIGAEQLALMKRTARLVHCARGGIVDEAALVDALREKRIAGAALDVFVQEPPPADHPLLQLDNVIATPHLGASTVEAQEIVALQVAEDIVRFFQSGTALNPVNAPRVQAELRATLAPFLEVAEKLGSFLAQASAAGCDRVTITYAGPLFQRDTALVKATVLKGLLSGRLDQPVNEVNAAVLAEERGIKVAEHNRGAGDGAFRNLLCVDVARGATAHSAEGTVFPDGDQRIVRVDGVLVEVPVAGHLLVMRNNDRPGVVGAVGTILGQRQVNISRMQVGLEPHGGQARSFWSLDRPVDDDTLREIRAVDNVLEALQVSL